MVYDKGQKKSGQNYNLSTISCPLLSECKNPKIFSNFQMGLGFNYQVIVSLDQA
jgi:hypothetical protein